MLDIEKINILNKQGMLTDEDRKQRLEHGCSYFTFESCIDLSKGVKVIPYGTKGSKYTIDQYSQDLAAFMCWWTNMVMKDLNGFSGFSHVKFDLSDFELININDLKK